MGSDLRTFRVGSHLHDLWHQKVYKECYYISSCEKVMNG